MEGGTNGCRFSKWKGLSLTYTHEIYFTNYLLWLLEPENPSNYYCYDDNDEGKC